MISPCQDLLAACQGPELSEMLEGFFHSWLVDAWAVKFRWSRHLQEPVIYFSILERIVGRNISSIQWLVLSALGAIFLPFSAKTNNSSTGVSEIDQYLYFGDFPPAVVQVDWSIVKGKQI